MLVPISTRKLDLEPFLSVSVTLRTTLRETQPFLSIVRKLVHKVAETEKKGSKSNFTVEIGTNSAPPHVKTKIEGKRKIDDLEFTRVRKKYFLKT